MSILQECPKCRKKQKVTNKKCKCGQNLDKAKKSRKVKYWINYRLPDKTQKRELVSGEGFNSYSIEDAKIFESKRKIQKAENKILDIKQESNITFLELSEWYKKLEKVKAQKAFWRTEISLNHFNAVFGQQKVLTIKPVDLENYQAKRKAEGKADNTIDSEIGTIRAMVNKGFDNDMVSGDTLKAFKKTKKLLKRNGNARDRILSKNEYEALCEHAPLHIKNAVIIAYHTGMRRGEILNLTWSMVDMKNRTITLEAEMTKDNEKRIIPISASLFETLKHIPKAIYDDHVLLFRGTKLKALGKALNKACKKAGITFGRFKKDGFVFHDLRHTFVTNSRKAKVQESVIMAITGHSTREMFDRYDKIDADDTREAVNMLEVFLQSVDHSVDRNEKRTQAN